MDVNKIFAPVARMETIRTVLVLATQLNFEVDVKLAFLYGELEEEMYVEHPQGYFIKGDEYKVYCLHKALYGLKLIKIDPKYQHVGAFCISSLSAIYDFILNGKSLKC